MNSFASAYLRHLAVISHGLLKSRAATDFAWLSAGRFIAVLAGIASIRVFTEVLPPNVFGEANLLVGLIGFGMQVFVAPLVQTYQRMYPIAVEEGLERRLNTQMMVLVGSLCAAIFALLLASLAFSDLLQTYGVTSTVLFAISLFIFASAVRNLMHATLSSARQQKLYAAWTSLEALALLVIVPAFIVRDPTVASFVLGQMAAVIASSSLCFVVGQMGRNYASARWIDSNSYGILVGEVVRFGWPFAVIAVFGWLMAMFDRYYLASAANLAAVGQYAASVAIASRIPTIPISIINEVFRPVIYDAAAKGDEHKWRLGCGIWLVMNFAVSVAAAMLVYVFGDVITFLLLASEYRDGAAQVLLVATIGFAFMSCSHGLDMMLLSRQKSNRIILPKIFGAMSAIALTLLLVPELGVIGAAYANAAAQAVMLVTVALLVLAGIQGNQGLSRQ